MKIVDVMKIKPLLMLLLECLLFQPPVHADPTITVRFCSSGFQVGVAPTTWGVIYVSTGLYSAEPMNTGECIPTYDPTTQVGHFYIVNSTGIYHIGQYYEYGTGNNTLIERLEKVKKPVLPVFGRVKNGDVIFRVGSVNYTIPVREVLPYLWEKDMINSLVAFPEGKGLVIVPTGILNVVEDNFTVVRKPGVKVGTTLLDLNFTYWVQYQYPFYMNGTVNGKFVWGKREKREATVTWDDAVKTFEKPLYIFYFNGSSVRPMPIMRIRVSLGQKSLEIFQDYSFENLASPYTTNESAITSTTTNGSIVSPPSSTLKQQSSSYTTPLESSGSSNQKNSPSGLLLLTVLGVTILTLIAYVRGSK